MFANHRPAWRTTLQGSRPDPSISPVSSLIWELGCLEHTFFSERPDTIRSIVASLVGDGESGDSLVDENEPINPLQQPEIEDYTDPNWEPEPIDAGPGGFYYVGNKYVSIDRCMSRLPCE